MKRTILCIRNVLVALFLTSCGGSHGGHQIATGRIPGKSAKSRQFVESTRLTPPARDGRRSPRWKSGASRIRDEEVFGITTEEILIQAM